MGFLKSLFGSSKEKAPNVVVKVEQKQAVVDVPEKKLSPEVQNLALLFMAERYKVGEKNYPQYMRTKYGVGFPNEKYNELAGLGYIRPSTAAESLSHLKATELKDIASRHLLKSSGKKQDIIDRIIAEVPEEMLDAEVTDRYWIITELGHNLLAKNPYVEYCMEQHPYALETIGLDIDAIAKLCAQKPVRQVRDVLWGEFNRKSLDYYKEGIEKGAFRNYCELLRVMALFSQEEGRSYDALALYARYLYYRANFEASMKALQHYNFVKDLDEATNTLVLHTEFYPFMAQELLNICNGCGFDSAQLKSFMNDAFSKEHDTGIFSSNALAELVMCGLNGDEAGEKTICRNAMKAAIKSLPRR